jgi:hypothetical protein
VSNDEKEPKKDHQHQNTRYNNGNRNEKTILRIFEQNFISGNSKIIIVTASAVIGPSGVANEPQKVRII